MARYAITPYDKACAATRTVYDEFMRLSGASEPPIWMTSLGHSPILLKAYWEKTRGCLLEGELPYVLKEMVVFAVSRENGAEYCTACHAHAVLQIDRTLTYADLVALLDEKSTVSLPRAIRGAVDFAVKMARNANAVSDDDFEQLAGAGYSDAEVKELLGVIDLAVMFNCYTSALRLPLDPRYRNVIEGRT